MHHNNYNSNPFRKRPHIDDVVKRDTIFEPAYSSIIPTNPQVSRYSVYDPSDPGLFVPCASGNNNNSNTTPSKTLRLSEPRPKFSIYPQTKPKTSSHVNNPIVKSNAVGWTPPEEQLPLYVYNGMKKFAEKYFPLYNKSATFQIKKFTTLEYLPKDIVIDEVPKKTVLFHCPVNKTVKWKIKPWVYKDCKSVDIHIAEGWCKLNSNNQSDSPKLTKYHSYFVAKSRIDQFDLTIESQCNNELIVFLIFDKDAITPLPYNKRIAYYFMLIISHSHTVRYIDYKSIGNVEGTESLIESKITNESGSIYFDEFISPSTSYPEDNLEIYGLKPSDLDNHIDEKEALDQIKEILAGNLVYGYDLDKLKQMIPDYREYKITFFDLKLSKCIRKNLEKLSKEEEYDFSSIIKILFDKEWSEKGKSCGEKLNLISDIICLMEAELNEEYQEDPMEIRENNFIVSKNNDYFVENTIENMQQNPKCRSPKITNEIIISDDEEDEENQTDNLISKEADLISNGSVEIVELEKQSNNEETLKENSGETQETEEVVNQEIEEEFISNPQVIEDAMLDCDVDSPIELFADDYSAFD